jgi:hypothetical protein
MPVKTRVKTSTTRWETYGKPQGEAGLLSRTRQFVNPYVYQKIDYTASDKMEFHTCDHVDYRRPPYGDRIRQNILVSDPWEIVATNNYVASISDEIGRHPVVADKRYPSDPGYYFLVENALVPEEELRDISLRGCALRLPSFKSSLSILNFLFELKDIPKMIKGILKARDQLEKRSIDWKNLPNHHLELEFGWLPFVSDILAIAQQLGTFRAKLKRLIAEQHKIKVGKFSRTPHNLFLNRQIHYGSGVYIGPSLKAGKPDMYAYATGGTEQCSVWGRRVVFTVKYSYWIPELTDNQVAVRGLCQALGVEWDPKIIWDAIPFSFLVDWAIDVGGWLSATLRKPSFKVSLRVHEFTVSQKHSYSYRKDVLIPSDWNPPLTPVNSGGRFTYTSKGKIFRRIKNSFITEDECKEMPWRGDPGAPNPRRLACFLSLVCTNAPTKKKPPRPRKKKGGGPLRWRLIDGPKIAVPN